MRARLTLSLMPVAAMALLVTSSLLIEACGGTEPRAELPIPTAGAESTFLPTSASMPEVPDASVLLRQALEGVATEADDTLGSRMQVRRLRIPSPGRGATQRFNFDEGKQGWITALPRAEVLTSPAYADGKVFLGGGFASHQFFAFDAFRGDLEWSLAAPDGGPTAAIIEGDRVLFNTESCTLFVADADTGALLWKRWLGDPLMSQPATAGDMVLSAYPANGAHVFGAFALSDGTPRWTLAIPADVIQAPHVRGDSAYFATMDGTTFRVRWRDGHVVWRKPLGATSAPWVDRGKVLLSRRVNVRGEPHEEPVVLSAARGNVVSRGERVAAPYLSGTSRDRVMGAAQAGAWGNVPHGQHLGLRNVASGWAFQGSSPAVADGRAYFAVGNELRARDVATGDIVWRRRYAEAGDAQTISPPAIVGSQLVYGTVDGHLFFSDIDTGATIRAFDVGQPIVFQPVVAQGWVYVATGEGNLIGLEIGDPELDGWHMWGGNAQHAGLVESPGVGEASPQLLASLDRPGRGTLRLGRFEDQEAETATDAVAEAEQIDETQPDLPLIGMSIEADVSGFVARVSVTQTFDNPHERPIEAVYLFPLPEDSAVDAMEMHIGDRVVRGRIKRKQQARRIYEEARESGRRAALLEQQRPNLFAQRVANIPPHERIEVRLEYVQTLPFDQGEYELVFPMSAPRRYQPDDPGAVVDQGNERREADRVDLAVNLRPGLPLLAAASPSHDVDVQRVAGGARVELEDRATGRDFVLRYRVGGEHPDAAVIAHRTPIGPDDDGDPNGYFSLVLQPPAGESAPSPVPREITFVIDRSSSMRGAPMAQAVSVMRTVIEGMREEDALNVLTFSDRVEAAFESPQAVTEQSRRTAVDFVDGVRAVGATEMVPAIQQALGSRGESERLPIVVLLTDGYIGNEADALRAIAGDLGDARLYTLGVGGAINRFLLTRAAEIGRGQAFFGTLGEEPEALAERFAALIDRPVFTDVEIDWGHLEVQDVYPRRLPDLFAGRPLVMHGRFDEGGVGRVRIRGSMNGQRFERAITVTLPKSDVSDPGTSSHATLWARAAVHDRMNRIYLRDDPALIEEVTALGLAHHLVTQWTSFVAVDEGPAEPPPAEARATISPARSLPGDPELRIPAPRDARAVTIVLPFGETIAAQWEPELDRWTARFLVPADAEEGTYPIEVLVTHADGRSERLRLWYTVDASAPDLVLELDGDVRPGETVFLRARQRITDADLSQVNRRRSTLTPEIASRLADARRVEARLPDGSVVDLEMAAPGLWSAEVRVPESITGTFDVEVVAVDLAANVARRRQAFEVQR